MPVWSDKLVQEVIRLILEAYDDPQFSNHSHGFRPERGCHTALREIYHQWSGTTWLIEGDISQCFDTLDHELLLKTLEERLHDGRFIHLIRTFLDAGYLEEWTFHQTLSGVPQGGIVSPILANVLLDKLDNYVETVLIPKYTKGAKRKLNPKYEGLISLAGYHRRKGHGQKAKELRQQAQKLPTQDTNDPNFRRLKYVRYADDFLLGFLGSRAEAEEIKRELKKFLQNELKLNLSSTKTLITHAKTEAARFLGYEITVILEDTKQFLRNTAGMGRQTKCRCVNGRLGLKVPRDVIKTKCKRYMRGGKAIHRQELINESDYTIVTMYQLEYRGIANYYRLAYNMRSLGQLKWVMETSLTKTLARKHKLAMRRVYEKYGTELVVDGKKYKGLQARIPRQEKDPLVATWGGVPLIWNIKATLEEHPPKIYNKRTELVQRLLAGHCELCGSPEQVEVHHVRKMSDLHHYPGREKPPWVKRMIELKRKTMPLCRTCHEDIHAGRPLRRQTIKLTDVKALQKQAMR
jgi:group II intron reverse transcriptase/maturase